MAPPEFSNTDFFNLQASVTKLDRAIEDANSQKTVRKGARKSSEHAVSEVLQADVEEDLGKVVNSPLRPARGPAYGCLPSEAVQPVRRLHEMLLSIVGPGGDPAILDDTDTAADLHGRVQALVARLVPDHPFLKVQFEFDGDDDIDGGDDELLEQLQQTPRAKGKGKQVSRDEQPSGKGKGTGKIVNRIEAFRIFLANCLFAMSSTCSGGSSRRYASERTCPRTTYSSFGRPTGLLRRVGRRPTHGRRRRRCQ